MKNRILFVIFCGLFWTGCYDEDALTPTIEPELRYSVPQGEHDYDDRIVDWFHRTGSYFLYIFNPKDVYWNISEWQEENINGSYYKGMKITLADEAYVGQQLDLIEEQFLNFYPDTLLRRCLPQKLLFCDTVGTHRGYLEDSQPDLQDVVSGFDYLAIRYGSAEIEDLSAKQRNDFLFNINNIFLKRLVSRKQITIPEQFYELSKYPSKRPSSYKDIYKGGFLNREACMKNNTEKLDDWNYYIQAILTYTLEELEAEQPDGDSSLKGILNTKKDTEGLIRAKYNVVVDFFKDEHHFDILAIAKEKK